MPWVAVQDGEKVGPEQVPKETDVGCPECNERMRVWSRSSDGKARHFKHIKNMGGGAGGGNYEACESVAESDKHIKWKSLAASRLHQEFGDRADSIRMEHELEAPHSDKDHRKGDVVMDLENTDRQLGDGLVIEVQHKNGDKDIQVTTADYLEQNYAVAWLYGGDFSRDRCRMIEVDFRQRARDAVGPEHFPPASGHVTYASVYINTVRDEYGEWSMEGHLPSEWCDEHAQAIWRSQEWESLFKPAENYTDIWCYSKVPATIIKNWVEPTTKEYWRSSKWEARFRGPHGFLEIEQKDGSVSAKVPFEKFIKSSDGARLINAIRDAYDSGRYQRSEGTIRHCPHCDKVESHDSIANGEIKRVTTCGNCGEWYTVWDSA